MKRTSGSRVNGCIYIVQSTKLASTVDFYLSEKRDVNAAKAFLRKALKGQRIPTKITLDAYAASHRAVAELKANGELPKASVGTDQQVPEQHHRTGPPTSEATPSPDAGIEELPNRNGRHRWH